MINIYFNFSLNMTKIIKDYPNNLSPNKLNPRTTNYKQEHILDKVALKESTGNYY